MIGRAAVNAQGAEPLPRPLATATGSAPPSAGVVPLRRHAGLRGRTGGKFHLPHRARTCSLTGMGVRNISWPMAACLGRGVGATTK
jgi:hypothetical protein